VLVETLLKLAALLALAALLVFVVVDLDHGFGDGLRRFWRRLRGDGYRYRRGRLRLLKRLEPRAGAKTRLRSGNGRHRLGLCAGGHAYRLGTRRGRGRIRLPLFRRRGRGRRLDRLLDDERTVNLPSFGSRLGDVEMAFQRRLGPFAASGAQRGGAGALLGADLLHVSLGDLLDGLFERRQVAVVDDADCARRVEFGGFGRLQHRSARDAHLFG